MIDLILLGSRIKVARAILSLTRLELATKIGIDVEFLNDIESGRRDITLRTISKLAAALDLELADLIIFDEE